MAVPALPQPAQRPRRVGGPGVPPASAAGCLLWFNANQISAAGKEPESRVPLPESLQLAALLRWVWGGGGGMTGGLGCGGPEVGGMVPGGPCRRSWVVRPSRAERESSGGGSMALRGAAGTRRRPPGTLAPRSRTHGGPAQRSTARQGDGAGTLGQPGPPGPPAQHAAAPGPPLCPGSGGPAPRPGAARRHRGEILPPNYF